MLLARSLVQGESYGLHYAGATPLPTRYPFGFPLLLSPVVALFPGQVHILRYFSLVATVANVIILFVGWPTLSRDESHGWGLMVASLYALSPLVIRHTRMVMSEPVFTTLVLLSFVLTEQYLASGVRGHRRPLALGALLTLIVFARTIGLVAVAAVLVRVALSKLALRTRLAMLARVALGGAMLLALVLAFTPVSVSDLVPAEYTAYFGQGSDQQETIEGAPMARLAASLRIYGTQHARSATIPIGGGASEANLGWRLGIPNLPLITGMVIGATITVGHVPMLGRRGLRPSVSFHYLAYLVAILLWPWPLVRFLYPVQPFLLYALLLGVQAIMTALVRIGRRGPRQRRGSRVATGPWRWRGSC